MNPTTVAQINLNHLLYNIRQIQKKTSPAKVIPVIKADAYGHGAVPVAKHLVKAGFEMFAVAQFQEAMQLRDSGITSPILIFGRLLPDEIPVAVKAGFRITIFGEEDVRRIDESRINTPAFVHVNVDTGMGRVGFLVDQKPDLFDLIIRSRHCAWEGLYSHFATADEQDKTYAALQLSRFRKLLQNINRLNQKPAIIHMANSGAVLDIADSYFDAVRPGITLYGHYPSSETSQAIDLKPVMTFKTYVAHVRQMPANHPISYGRRWTTSKATQIAVLPVGYADGMRHELTNKGEVLIQGNRYPIVGTVTMDQTMVHVEKDTIKPGDEAILWGESNQGGEALSALEVANQIGTIPYELVCGVSQRVKRIYIED